MTALEYIKDVSLTIGGVMAFTTFALGFLEYGRQYKAKRVEAFVQLRRRFLETTFFQTILNQLPDDAETLADIPIQDRRNFIGFLEEVALMVNSGQIRPDVAHYMFGYYVLLASRSQNLWCGLDRDDKFWEVFRRFAIETEGLVVKPLPEKTLKF